MTACPKPPKTIRTRHQLRRRGAGDTEWYSFRHSVAYPLLWMAVKREGLIFDEETNTARLLCVEPGCDIDLSISLLSRANENGEWWHIEELELHHKEGRVGDLKFDMRNLVCYCHKHHMKEERRREREGKR